ncbi:MAG: hypothetical protein IJD30_03870 [Clostridia bacterium]|nr:hypothetical protein [Clostridia bacterium]
MIIVRSRKELLWTFIFAIAGIAAGLTLQLSPLGQVFSNSASGELIVVVDAGHQDLAYALI